MSQRTFEECFNNFLSWKFELPCFNLLLAKMLGILIIVFSCTLKVPQIKTMLSDNSMASQLSEFSLFADIFSYLSIILYSLHFNYPFTSYGENLTICIQNAIILYLFCRITKSGFYRLLGISSIFLITALCLHDKYVPEHIWLLIGSCGLPFIVLSRLFSILYCFREKSSGPLSRFTFILGALGNLTRIFTTITETKDSLLITQIIISFLLNFTLIIQISIYGNKSTEKTDELKDKKQK